MADTDNKTTPAAPTASGPDHRLDRRALIRTAIALTGGYTLLQATGMADIWTAPLEAQGAAGGEAVKYPSGTAQIEGFLVKPTGSGRFPAVVIIHENRGLTDHIRDVARRFAAEGFVAFAPDLLSRRGGTASMKTPNEATAALTRLSIIDGMNDVREGVNFISKDPSVDAQKVAVVGFGWGGWRSFMAASQVPTVSKLVVFYGITPDAGLDKIRASVLAHYAARDRGITGNSQWTAREMKKLGKNFTFYIYDNTDAGFFNDTGGERYNAEAAKQAWARTLQFLRG
jgi:carboxymethylenebutenolidase